MVECSSDDSHNSIDFLYFDIYVVLKTEVIIHMDTNIFLAVCGF